MRRTFVTIVAATFVAGSANAASILLQATNPLSVAGSVSTVTVTLTVDVGGELVPAFSSYGVQVGWDNTVVRVVGSDGTTTFGNSAQSPILAGLAGSTMPACVAQGSLAGMACTIITQSALSNVTVPAGTVIGTLLLEVLPPPGGPDPAGTPLGLSVLAYNNNGVTIPGSDPNLTIDPSFSDAQIVPEPTTAALLGVGLLGLGLLGRRRTLRMTPGGVG